jgi:hypothetical protein
MFGSDASTTSGGLPPDRQGSFNDRFEKWGSSPAGSAPLPAPHRLDSFNNRFGNWGSAPAGGFGDTRSPALRALENYKRSAAPEGLVSTLAQGAPLATPNLPIDESALGDRSENAPGATRPEINSRSYRVSSASSGHDSAQSGRGGTAA